MNKQLAGLVARTEVVALSWLGWQLCQSSALANPVGGAVARGTASFNSSGSQLTVNVSSPTATINWQTFNIGAGETTTFVQPSSSSVVWNQINDSNPSQILGALNANGYVILQNQNGFYVGGQASITAHGLIMTTSPTPAPDLTTGGPWSFNAPPPTAKIINYGQINIGGGGTAFLIAADIENDGTISAPSGKIGLYDGENVLVSLSPDARGLSAQVTLPQGSVDNEGKLIADGGTIAAQVKTVNQNGLVQADSVLDANGVIELVASDSLTLGASSDIEAQGDNSTANSANPLTSAGGSVSLESRRAFADLNGSVINVSGSAGGGDSGQISISAPAMSALNSTLLGQAQAGFASGTLALATTDISVNSGGQAATGVALNANALATQFSQISLNASDNIEVSAQWDLAAQYGITATVSLVAGNTINLDAGSSIDANGSSIALNAATVNIGGTLATDSLQTTAGSINVTASQAINLGATADIEAQGDNSADNFGASPGGSVSLQSTHAFDGASGSVINVSGSTLGGAGGQVTISAPQMSALDTTLSGTAISGYAGGSLAVDTANILLNSGGSAAPGTLALNGNFVSGGFSQVALQAAGNLASSSGSEMDVNGGKLSLSGQTVNLNGTLQANSIGTANGVIEVDATAAITLGASSSISAHGDSTSGQPSPGGFVVLKAGSTFTDTAGSAINVGGASGGQDGIIEIFGTGATGAGLNSSLGSYYALLVNPYDLTLSAGPTDTATTSPTLNASDLDHYSQLDLRALDNIELQPAWTLPNAGIATRLDLTAGNNLILDDGSGISAGQNWNVDLAAGNTIYLNGTSSIQTQNGDIALLAPAIHTLNGASVSVAASSGNLELGATWTLDDAGATANLSLDAGNILTLDSGAGIVAGNNWNVSLAGGTLNLKGNSAIQAQSGDILLQASTLQSGNGGNLTVTAVSGNIELASLWTLTDAGISTTLGMSAGNSITIDDSAGILAGNDWNLNLTAGTALTAGSPVISGSDGVYLNGSAYIQSQNGNINVSAANEVQLATSGSDVEGSGGIRTLGGGNISVSTTYGDVNTGANPLGYNYLETVPYYIPDTFANNNGAALGGISTVAGGNVVINAGGNIYSYLPSGTSAETAGDGGSGAFGPEPGNVTITAQGSIYGHYVLANGVGTIQAGHDVGAANGRPFALSLVTGTWNVDASGSIYLQEVRNPNGVFDNLPGAGYHLFDYDPEATVDLNAYTVYLTGQNVPRPDDNVLVLYPPILDISAGAGGVILESTVTLFPSDYQSIDIVTTDLGNFAIPLDSPVSSVELAMSDSSQTSWTGPSSFGNFDHGSTPPTLNDPNPVIFNIAGDMDNINLFTSKATQLTVDGNMNNCSFSGQNLSVNDKTVISVGGQIFNQGSYSFGPADEVIPPVPAADLLPGMSSSWDNIFTLALNPATIAGLTVPTSGVAASQLAAYAILNASLFTTAKNSSGQVVGINPGFVYDASTGTLGFGGPMPQNVLSALSTPTLTILRLGPNGLPVTATETVTVNGQSTTVTHFVTDQVSWADPTVLTALSAASQTTPSPSNPELGYRVGGPGEFDIKAGSISLGNSYGILSTGVSDPQGGFDRYVNLAPETPVGATLNVTITGDLVMQTSTIAAIGGGDVNLMSTGGSLDLGSEALFNTSRQVGFGVFTSGLGNVSVTAAGDVDIDGSRIATYDGGNIFVESFEGDVNVGSGGDTFTGVGLSFVDKNGHAEFYAEDVFGNGIVANTLLPPPAGAAFPSDAAALPGNITVESPNGNITGSLGGITQQALDGNTAGGPVISLSAGTPGVAPTTSQGNIDFGNSPIIGGTVNIAATGDINVGVVLSKQNTSITAGQNINAVVVAGGQANVNGGGAVTGTIVGVGGADVSGGDVTASVLSQNASVNGASSTSTLGSSANATSTSQSAANQSDTQAKQQLAENSGQSDDDQKKKKPLIQRVKRVTVILPSKT